MAAGTSFLAPVVRHTKGWESCRWARRLAQEMALQLAVGQVADSCFRAARWAERRLPRLQVECTPFWAVRAADRLALVVEEEAGK